MSKTVLSEETLMRLAALTKKHNQLRREYNKLLLSPKPSYCPIEEMEQATKEILAVQKQVKYLDKVFDEIELLHGDETENAIIEIMDAMHF